MASDKPIIAIATGDPAGIGPEISLKAALDRAVRAACRPILVSDAAILKRHAEFWRRRSRSTRSDFNVFSRCIAISARCDASSSSTCRCP